MVSLVQMTTDENVQSSLLRLQGFNLMSHILKEYPNDIRIITLVRYCFRSVQFLFVLADMRMFRSTGPRDLDPVASDGAQQGRELQDRGQRQEVR